MEIKHTHTFVILELSTDAFKEIYEKLKEAKYDHAFIHEEGRITIDMHGIAVATHEKSQPK